MNLQAERWTEHLWLLTPVIPTFVVTLLGVWLAWWQMRIAREKLRYDLYDRRFVIYEALIVLMTAVYSKKADGEMIEKARAATYASRFLLDEKLSKYAYKIFIKCLQSYSTEYKFDTDKSRFELSRQTLVLTNMFKPYLLLKDFTSAPLLRPEGDDLLQSGGRS